jgi:dipeptidyl aminopeptidase/acylaminoacyl peptidase
MRLKRTCLVFAAALLVLSCAGEKPIIAPATEVEPAPAGAAVQPTTTPPAPTLGHEDKELIPRQLIFGNPENTVATVSPDGKSIAYLAPEEAVLNIWVAPAGKLEAAKAVTHDRGRGIARYWWAYDNEHILYLKDQDGDENWRVIALNPATGEEKTLTPERGVHAIVQAVSPLLPNEVLIAMNDRNPQFHELYRADLATGKLTRVQENDRYIDFMVDDTYEVRFAVAMTPDGGMEYLKPGPKGEWAPYMTIGAADMMTFQPLDFDKTRKSLLLLDGRDRDKTALFEMDVATQKKTLIAESAKADITSAMIQPLRKTVQAVESEHTLLDRQVLDPKLKKDFEVLAGLGEGVIHVVSRSLDDTRWIVMREVSDGPLSYYFYDRKSKKATFLFYHRPKLAELELAKMYPVVIPARDGLELVSYLTLPPAADKAGRPDAPMPLVLDIHGGPWGRDSWGYVPEHQWLANRGYAVLSINYRGSTGFGKGFINAGDREWGGKMHDDLIDAVNWAIKERIAEPKSIAILGWSYGGYATLTGITMTPEVFACGVAGVGPSNLVTFMETVPPYWKPLFELFAKRIGDPRTLEGKKFLMSRSPISYVDQIKRPLLIGQGANDPRVNRAESDQIAAAMKAKGIPVIYALYGNEGHGFYRPENRLSFYSMAEIFLARCLDGAYQPIGDDFKGSAVELIEGAALIPGVEKAMETKGANK